MHEGNACIPDVFELKSRRGALADESPVLGVGVGGEQSAVACHADHWVCIVRLVPLVEALTRTQHHVDPACVHYGNDLFQPDSRRHMGSARGFVV